MNTVSKTIEEQTFQLLEATGLNWSVDKKPLFANQMDPTGTIAVGTIPTQSFGIFRNDNENWLGTVGSQYAPFQNHELVQMMVEATESLDLNKRTGGALYGGGRVYLKIELPSTFIGKSPVRRFATANNSHDGSSSISFGSYSEVQVCTNGMYREYDRVSLGKIRHTANYKDRVKSAIEALKNLMGLDNKLMDNFKRMADLKVNDEMIERVMRRIFEVDPAQQQAELSTRKKNNIKSFAEAITTEFELEGATVWGLFNGVTRYTNHVINHKTPTDRLEYLMSGRGYEINNMAYEELLKFVEDNTVEYHTVSK